ncbi:MAG: glycosyltransferase family 2 protein [Pedosphaera sp.]|nr:glycosyltransferase family 2 protein [Pedosphaera sp.]
MKQTPELSIIIVNWNSKDYVRKCVQSIHANTSGTDFEIVVVDGASYDGCGEMLAHEFPGVRFIQCEKNVGFARANNLAFEQSRGNCLLFLNPDTEVVDTAINVLRRALLEIEGAGIVGAKLLNTDGSVQTSCVQTFPTILNQVLDTEILRRAFPRHSGIAPLFALGNQPAPVQVLSGACLMMRRAVFVQVARFSEDYFMYAEDLDLCYKVNRAGLKNFYVPAASIIHHGGGSSKPGQSTFSDVMMRESVFRFLTKVRGRWYSAVFRFSLALSALGRLALLLLLFPVKMICGEAATVSGSMRKWLAILKWALGLQPWVARYS